MSAKSQRKGKAGELQVVAILRAAFPEARRRAQEEAQAGNLKATASSLGRDLAGTPGWCVQVQLAKAPTIERKFAEAEAARHMTEKPVAITRRCAMRKKGKPPASGPWLATLLAHDFAELVQDLGRARKTALDLAEDALRLKNEADALLREKERLEEDRRKGVLAVMEGDPLAIVADLQRQVEKLKAERDGLAAELARETFGP